MKTLVVTACLSLTFACPGLAQDTPDSVVEGTQVFGEKVLATGLENPWEVTFGPDNFLWVTERTGGRIVRINPADGSKTTAIEIADAVAPGGQDGLLGLALHPELLTGTGNEYVYTAYSYLDRDRGPDETVTDEDSPYRYLYTKIVRLTFDPATGTLSDPVELIAGLPIGNDHGAGRLKIGPDGKLYFTTGDGGKNQLGNYCLEIEAQRLPTADELAARNYVAYQGKSLRMNLDGSIPEDNPEIDAVRSHIFTYGHRNAQGIDFAPGGTLYASEHGPKSDDEINILLPGRNYGWPHISGFRDDQAYEHARWKDAATPCENLMFTDLAIDPSVPRESETSWAGEFEPPIVTMFTVPSDWNFSDPACGGVDFVCWPTVAPSSIEVYMPTEGGIPGWENSLIVTTLKRGSIYRIPLAEDGRTLRGPIERYFRSENRFRDVAFSPDRNTIYVATDNGGVVGSLAGGATFQVKNPGSILAYTYTGEGQAATKANGATGEE